MKALMRLVGGVGHEFCRWMPVGIDHASTKFFVFGFEHLPLSVLADDRRAMVTAYVKGVVGRVGTIGCVAVDACAGHRCVLNDGSLLECSQVALVQSHLSIYLVPGWYESISKSPRPQMVCRYIHGKVFVLCPMPIGFDRNGEYDLPPFVLFGEIMPFVQVKLGILCVAVYSSTFRAFDHNVKHIARFREIELEWRNLCGDSHTDIIGKYGWQLFAFDGIDRTVGTAGYNKALCHQDDEKTECSMCFFHVSKSLSCLIWNDVLCCPPS